MSDLISIDVDRAVATMELAAWDPVLVRALRSVFAVTDDMLCLDYSHLSSERPEPRWLGLDLWNARERCAQALTRACALGQIDLFIEIVQDQNDVWISSRSLDDRENLDLFRGDGATTYVLDNLPDLRGTALREVAFSSGWIRSGLERAERSIILRDHELVETMIDQISYEGNLLQVLRLLQPRHDDDGWAYAKVVDNHWSEIQAFITGQIAHDWERWSDRDTSLVRGLFRHSAVVQASHSIHEQLLESAPPSTLTALLPLCRRLTAGDVRVLLQRYRDADDGSRKAMKAGIRSAVLTFGCLAGTPLPSDIVLAGLWSGFEFPDVATPTPVQHEVGVGLRELPADHWRPATLWDQLGPDARAAWRAGLLHLVCGDTELAHGLIDFACRWLDQGAFMEIEPVLRKTIHDVADLDFLEALADRGPRLVTLRARGLARAGSESIYEDAPASDDAHVPFPEVGAKTWMGDPAVERVVHRLMTGVEAAFCKAYPDNWGADEEMLTAELLANTQNAARVVTEQLRWLARTTRGRHPTLSVRVRQPGKSEEGRNTATGAPLAADILFLTRIQDGAKVVIERATLVQVKKRRGDQSRRFGSTIMVDLEQCQNLLCQSEHAYYLFLTPPSPRARLWITPARVVGNLTRLNGSRSSVSALQVRDASCSYADFFLTHLVGLWSGDERASTVAIAEGDRSLGRTPRHIVEILVQRDGE